MSPQGFPVVSTPTKLARSPVVDGVITAEEYQGAAFIESLRDRVTGFKPRDGTQVYLGYTDEGIYVAFLCTDEEPEKIIAREIIPNAEFRGEDQVQLSMNLFGTRAFDQLNEFTVNALGTQAERLAGGRTNKREWRGEWVAKAVRTETGWACEMLIPWRILTYPDQNELSIDLNLIRKQGRTLYEQSFANFRPNPQPELQGRWLGVQAPKPRLAKPQILVYDALDVEGGKVRNRAGVDAKIPLTATLSAIGSLFPDFRNVEDVIAGNDFVRIERVLNDPRPFFQEGGNFFNLNDRFSYGQMFYSRRITDFDFGAKVFGNVSQKTSIGALHTRGLDGDSTHVIKVTNTESGQKSQRFFVTDDYRNGRRNTSYGGSIQRRGPTLGLNAEFAAEQDPGQKPDTAMTVNVGYQRPTTSVGVRYIAVEPRFNPSLGFIPWVNRRGHYAFVILNRDWRSGPFRNYNANVFRNEFREHNTGRIQDVGWRGTFDLSTWSDTRFSIGRIHEEFADGIDEVTSYGVTFNSTNRFRRIGLFYESGIRRSLSSDYTSLDATWRIRNNFDIGLRRSLLRLGGTDEQTIFTAQYQLAADQLITTRIATLGGSTNAYLAYRKAGLAGTETYLIIGDPNAQRTTNRISLKLVAAY